MSGVHSGSGDRHLGVAAPGTMFDRIRSRIPRSLGAKLVAILTGVALLGAASITLLLALVITPSFDRLEAQAIDGHVERTRAALTEYASKVEASVRDYGDRNESHDYMGAPDLSLINPRRCPRRLTASIERAQ